MCIFVTVYCSGFNPLCEMFSKLFGKKKEKEPEVMGPVEADWSFLGTDMHSHLIPGIDDGSPDIMSSLAMIKEIQAMGFKQIVTTPHIKFDHYKNTPDIILNGLKTLQENLKVNDINIPVRAAAEYYVDDIFMELLEEGNLLTIQKNEVLIEFSFMFEPMNLLSTIFKIQTKGYKPIVAHPERYVYFHQKPEIYTQLRERGCYLQLNALSILGYYGRREKDVAEKLLQQNMYDYCGSDMHHIKHADNMRLCGGQKGFQMLKEYPFRNKNIVLE